MITSADHFNRAIALWFDLTGMDPNAKSWNMRHWGLKNMNDELEQSMDYDKSFITTYLLLDAFSTSYFKEAKVSVHEFDEDPDKIFDYMDKVREFKKLIRAPEIMRPADEFFEATRQALLAYGIESDRINKFFEDRSHLAIIRRDALKSANCLRADQFLAGEVDPDTVKPVYNKTVFGYWNINSMIEHVCGMPSGVSLNLIRDPDELHSYFAFAIRNGGNLIFLTDSQEYAHPLGRSMARRPDREFDERISKNWFPYQLLSIKYDEKGNPYHDKYRESQAKGLVPHQPHHFELKKLEDLELGQIVWTTLMFDLIVENYWRKPIEPRALSYTNEMIRLEDQNTLIARAAQSNLPVVGYQPLSLPILTPKDVMTDALDEKALGKRWKDHESSYGANRWMEERYGERVPIEVLNQIGLNDGSQLFISSGASATKPKWGKEGGMIVPVGDEVKKATTKNHLHFGETPLSHFEHGSDARNYGLERVDATLFGTREQIDADRKFIARVNFARGIQREADAEFVAERPRILKLFKDKIIERADILMTYAHHEYVEKSRNRFGIFGANYKDSDPEDKKLERYRFACLNDLTRKLESYEYSRTTGDPLVTFDQGHNRQPYYHRCYLTGAKASWQLAITPGCPADLAWLLGMEVEEMPIFLQHWNPGDDSYVGNYLLQRIDPLEWRLDNPWDQVSFDVSFYLSKRGLAQARKELPCPKVEDVSHIYHSGITRQNGRSKQSRVSHNNWRPNDYIKELDNE